MARIIGMDEAGYGPNLGPLVVTATVWDVPGDPLAFSLTDAFSPVMSSKSAANKLQIGDSKTIYQSGKGYAGLERVIWTLLSASLKNEHTEVPATFHSLLHHLQFPETLFAPWFQAALALPMAVTTASMHSIVDGWQQCCARHQVQLLNVAVDVMEALRFNNLLDQHGTKGVLHSRNSFQLLKRVWSPGDGRCVIYIDKHGGRNRYQDLIAEILDGEMIFTLTESLHRSHYRVAETDILIESKAETHFPVAVASIFSKYLREMAMELFNDYWQEQIEDLKPTKGYPVDAKRFLQDINAKVQELNIPLDQLWRKR